MPLDPILLDQLLHDTEGNALDFKQDQYDFKGADDKQKSELLKDILAFVNAWRGQSAYILIGVKERQGQRSEVVGVTEHLDDASLQQFVTSKTQRPVQLSYHVHRTRGVLKSALSRFLYRSDQSGSENSSVNSREILYTSDTEALPTSPRQTRLQQWVRPEYAVRPPRSRLNGQTSNSVALSRCPVHCAQLYLTRYCPRASSRRDRRTTSPSCRNP